MVLDRIVCDGGAFGTVPEKKRHLRRVVPTPLSIS
jgi:hypothetical protein